MYLNIRNIIRTITFQTTCIKYQNKKRLFFQLFVSGTQFKNISRSHYIANCFYFFASIMKSKNLADNLYLSVKK